MGPRRPLLLLFIAAFLLALPASAMAAKARTASPTVKSVSPKKVRIGQTLTIKGKNFVKGNRKNSVVFSNSKRAAVFLRAGRAGKTSLKVQLSDKLLKLLTVKNGSYVGTRLRLRVISRRAGVRLSAVRSSPVVYPAIGKNGAGGGGGGGVTGPTEACPAGSEDGDLIPYDVEVAIQTNPCNKDTDGDGMEDGWEYQSALDLNQGGASLPYPGKRNYPNPLDNSSADLNADFDGDALLAWQESELWKKFCPHSIPLCYSSGKQFSRTSAADLTPADGGPLAWLDVDDDDGTYLSDDERDADGDKLSNYVESAGPLSNMEWWTAVWTPEIAYPWASYLGTDFADADTDGDTVLDGDDDQDYDDWSNVLEQWRENENGLGPDLFVHPFNPCLPNPESRSCSRYIPIGSNAYPPFDGCIPDDNDVPPRNAGEPIVWPRPTTAPACDPDN
jgi:hypothetical protein